MRSTYLFGVSAALLLTSAMTPAPAADMTNERALNPQREPQNWILHHGNYQGHRFSTLNEINTDTVKNLKPVFTDRKSTRLNSSHLARSRMPSSA